MASSDQLDSDPLLRLRHAISTNNPPVPTRSEDAGTSTDVDLSLATATHLHFSEPSHRSFALDVPTRFVTGDKPVDLRSIFFAWQKKDVVITDYIASATRLNEELSAPGAAGGSIQTLRYVESLDLITWLEGSDDSEYIKPLNSDATTAQALDSAKVASGAAGGIATVPSGTHGGRPDRHMDPRLVSIYKAERKMLDRNSFLRGIKPTDFSHVRKSAELFNRSKHRSGHPLNSSTHISSNPSLISLPKKGGRRPDPIILLSPSASSLLRMSNVKSFLGEGKYIPPDSSLAGSSSSANLLHISRLLPSIDPTRPIRFILVDTPEQFKPDYWNRVVAVFTTGQTWQFKSYRWQHAPDLFRQALGIYIGWKGEEVPSTVKGWGRGVMRTAVEKWNNNIASSARADLRWRDTEVVESIWGQIEEAMRSRGWGKDSGPTAR
ncbi:MAG: hypothetical protein M1825_001397 [Sarcosagium campestre]|nr:MAG: hypothetical protein M1825_001397 [Sarcosagium campestre]